MLSWKRCQLCECWGCDARHCWSLLLVYSCSALQESVMLILSHLGGIASFVSSFSKSSTQNWWRTIIFFFFKHYNYKPRNREKSRIGLVLRSLYAFVLVAWVKMFSRFATRVVHPLDVRHSNLRLRNLCPRTCQGHPPNPGPVTSCLRRQGFVAANQGKPTLLPTKAVAISSSQ